MLWALPLTVNIGHVFADVWFSLYCHRQVGNRCVETLPIYAVIVGLQPPLKT